MRKTILRYMVYLAIFTITASSILVLHTSYKVFNEAAREDLKREAAFFLSLLEEGYSLSALLSTEAVIHHNLRLTHIGKEGVVLYDNRGDRETMDNHGDRNEVLEAKEKGEGEHYRMSYTLGTQTFYWAHRLGDGTILRFSKTTESALSTFYRLLSLLLGSMGFAIILAYLVAGQMTERILAPINALNPARPLESSVYDELSPLLLRISRQNAIIQNQLQELQEKQEVLESITNNVSEALMILDQESRLVWMNPSAQALFPANVPVVELLGKSVFTVSRDLSFIQCVKEGHAGIRRETLISIGDRRYEVLSSPLQEGEVKGLILLFLDATKRYEVETLRKEFSATVSHELRTPLTSILSFAELLKEGLVEKKEQRRFAKNIHEEALRLTHLIDNILKLSRLDEKVELGKKHVVDLKDLAEKVVESLSRLALEKKVRLLSKGERLLVTGDSPLLFEMLYNLCDNAIKYNKEQGLVVVEVLETSQAVLLRVSDTGIGIPSEHVERVFDRFYRVDKSHAKQTGGTGLGLSIVKNGAIYHGAKVNLQSKEQEGTTITLEFPKTK